MSATTECDELSGSEPETLLSTQTSTLAFTSDASNNVEIMPEITKEISVIEPRVETDQVTMDGSEIEPKFSCGELIKCMAEHHTC